MKKLLAITAWAVMARSAALAATMASQPWVTNRIAEAEARVGARISAATNAIPAPDYSTGNAQLVATIEATAPAPGNYAAVSNRAMTAIQSHQSLWPAVSASTNYTDRALGAFASTGAVARAATYGTPTRWTDATGCVWEVVSGWLVYTNSVVAHGWLAYQYATDSGPFGNTYELRIRPEEGTDDEGYAVAAHTFPDGVQPSWNNDYERLYDSDVDFYGIAYGDTIRVMRGVTNLVGRVALTNDIPDVTAAIREHSLGGIWDRDLEVWWTPIMENGALRYIATTNVNLNAGN